MTATANAHHVTIDFQPGMRAFRQVPLRGYRGVATKQSCKTVRHRKIIYIVGLGHSGSTVLDMLLTTSGKAVGLGQIWNVLREDPSVTLDRVCSCGASALDCKFWGPVLEQIVLVPDAASLPDRYRLVLERVERLYGSDITVVDSSKTVENLAILTEQIPGLNITALHNIKDVRPFTISVLDNLARKDRGWELPEKIFLQWYRGNRLTYAVAGRLLQQPPLRTMYEGLCLATEAATDYLARSLGENYIDPSAALGSGKTHIISGNRLRLREVDKVKKFAYDYRWLARGEWLRPYVLLPMVRRYNERCLREVGGMQ